MTLVDLAVGVAMAIGIVGILVPLLPGTLLVAGALLVWALEVGETAGWVVFGIGAAFLALGLVVKYALPGRNMKRAGVPNSTLLTGAGVGVVGFFVIPVLGAVIGFVAGVHLAEVRRVGADAARGTTVHALKAVGLSLAIELLAAILAAATWAVGVVVT